MSITKSLSKIIPIVHESSSLEINQKLKLTSYGQIKLLNCYSNGGKSFINTSKNLTSIPSLLNSSEITIQLNGFKLPLGKPFSFASPKTHSNLDLQIYGQVSKFEDLQALKITDISSLNLALDSEQYENFYNLINNNIVLAFIELSKHFHKSSILSSLNFNNFPIKNCDHLYKNIFKEDQMMSLPNLEKANLTNVTSFSNEQYDFGQSLIDKLISNLSLGGKLEEPTKVCVIGDKDVGKSTFNKYLINLLVNDRDIFYLDLDPGQSEFSPPSFLSLVKINRPIFSPPFMRPLLNESLPDDQPDFEIVDSCCLGELSPASSKVYRDYISIVNHLYKKFKTLAETRSQSSESSDGSSSRGSCSSPILFINTMGWIEKQGLTILSEIVKICEVEEICQLLKDVTDGNGFGNKITNQLLREQSPFESFNVDFTYLGKFLAKEKELDLDASSFRKSKSKKLALKPKDYREMMLNSHILNMSNSNLIEVKLSETTFNVNDKMVQPEDYLRAAQNQLVAIFNNAPRVGDGKSLTKFLEIKVKSANENCSDSDEEGSGDSGSESPSVDCNLVSGGSRFGMLALSSSRSMSTSNDNSEDSKTDYKSESGHEICYNFVQDFSIGQILKNSPENFDSVSCCLGYISDIDPESDKVFLKVPTSCVNWVKSNLNSPQSLYIVKTERGLILNNGQLKILNSNREDFIEGFDRLNMVVGSDLPGRVRRVRREGK